MDHAEGLHYRMQFCGEPCNAILYVSDDLLTFILALLKNDPIPAPKASIEAWLKLLSILEAHWIIPQLYWCVGKLPSEYHPPKKIIDRMRMAFQRSRGRQLQLEKQLGEITAAFSTEGVDILVLKGPAVARSAYPDPALRPAADLDLLVSPDQMNRARSLLESLNYRCLGKRFEISRDFYNDEIFLCKNPTGSKRQIELHWDLHRFSGIKQEGSIEDLFVRAVKVKATSFTFLALDPVDALLHRAINNAFDHDQDMRFCWIYDIKLLASRLVIPDDWKTLQQRSVDWCARLAVEHSLRLAQIWVGLRLPSEFENFSRWPLPSNKETDAWNHVVNKTESLKALFRLHLSDSTGLIRQIRYFLHLLFPSPEYIRRSYPSSKKWLLPFGYLRRWSKWLKVVFKSSH